MQAVDKNKSGGIDYTGLGFIFYFRICYGFDESLKIAGEGKTWEGV